MGYYKKKSNEQGISELMGHLIDDLGIRDQYTLYLVRKHFKLNISPLIFDSITDFYMTKNKTLHIHILSASMKDSLMLQRERLMELINTAIGEECIKALSIH